MLQLFSAGGAFGNAALHLGEFDEPALVEVDESALFGIGGADPAGQSGQFGGESVVVGDGGRTATACSPVSRRSGRVIAARM